MASRVARPLELSEDPWSLIATGRKPDRKSKRDHEDPDGEEKGSYQHDAREHFDDKQCYRGRNECVPGCVSPNL